MRSVPERLTTGSTGWSITEPTLAERDRYRTLTAFEDALEAGDPDLPASSLYAYAALDDGHPYINFTPSTGNALGGLTKLADRRGVPHMGRDAKTGETLVKSARQSYAEITKQKMAGESPEYTQGLQFESPPFKQEDPDIEIIEKDDH